MADSQPDRGSSDADILAHARTTNQIIATSNYDMIILCAELGESVLWIDPRSRQFRRAELAGLAFNRIEEWERLFDEADESICVKALRTKTEAMSLERATHLARQRMRRRKAEKRRSRPPKALGDLLKESDLDD